MKQAINRFLSVMRLSDNMIPFLLAALVIPGIVLMGFGIFAIYRHGYVLFFMLVVAASAALTAIFLQVLKKRGGHRHNTPNGKPGRKKVITGTNAAHGDSPDGSPADATTDSTTGSLVRPSADWGDFDIRSWEAANAEINRLLEEDSHWQAMQHHAIGVVRFVAEAYYQGNRRGELAFTAPELLRMMEEVSRRYRRTLLDHVPFVERVNLSTIKMAYDHRDKAKTAGRAWNAYRAFRIFTPTGLVAEARSRMVNHFFAGLRSDFEHKLKQAFLQEVASVAIDLYSGRFRLAEEVPGRSGGTVEDEKRMAPAPEPLRVCLVGQVSSGKSSVINALTGRMNAEVSVLPSTDAATVHQCRVEGIDLVHLVDLPGIDGGDRMHRKLVDEVVQSDVVLWVVKANQSARQADAVFRKKIDAFYADEKNRFRRRPVMIGVLNQIDRLKPQDEWPPPRGSCDSRAPHHPSAADAPVSPKAEIIRQALEYNQKILAQDQWIALSVSPDREHFNVSRLRSLLASEYEAAIQTQFNRRRMESGDSIDLAGQCRRLVRAGRSLFGIYSG